MSEQAKSSDARSPHTDALDTLGSIITENEKRDAIHLAVENVVAAHVLRPGEHVGFWAVGIVGSSSKPVGIVDPFLKTAVNEGEHFWLIVYPRQITSLRHVWTHPAFPDASELKTQEVAIQREVDPVAESRRWIDNFAASIDQTTNRLMEAAATWINDREFTYDNSRAYSDFQHKFPEFWGHYEVVTGAKVEEDDRERFFTCGC
ncbi:MAG: hypothetical protein P4L67_05115 [Candidatus Pacebacteria bacterium]|nr:hypothetical protein [Candidatus Paceibacterota bacterium]